MNSTTMMINPKPTASLPGNAAKRKYRRILSEALSVSSLFFIQKQNFRQGMLGLDLNCGEGDLTFRLAEKVGANGSVTGLDENPVFIKIAEEKATQSALRNIQFHLQNFVQWKNPESFDFVHGRFLLSQSTAVGELLTQLFKALKSGGFIMLEEMDFSDFQCFPYCFAFDRSWELVSAIHCRRGFDPHIGSKLTFLLQQAGFQNIQVQQIAPSFLKENEKSIASITLESIASDLLELQLISSTELQALLFELKAFEKMEDTLISLPGIFQVTGYKS